MITEYELDQQTHERAKTDTQEAPLPIRCPNCGAHTGHYDLRGQLEAALAAREEPLAEAREALRAYVSEYGECPGIEVEPGVTSGCMGEGDECPTCKAVSDAA
jgi:hypothetical protein